MDERFTIKSIVHCACTLLHRRTLSESHISIHLSYSSLVLLIIVNIQVLPCGELLTPPLLLCGSLRQTAWPLSRLYGWMGWQHVKGLLIPSLNELLNSTAFTLTWFPHVLPRGPSGLLVPTGGSEGKASTAWLLISLIVQPLKLDILLVVVKCLLPCYLLANSNSLGLIGAGSVNLLHFSVRYWLL